MNKDKDKYREFCLNKNTMPIFNQSWWLDTTCGEHNWQVVILERTNSIVAALPYYTVKRRGLTYIIQPALTQTLGPWIKPSNSKYAKSLEQEKKTLQKLFKKLPRFDYYQQSWNYNQKNWLPLHWMGYHQKSSITYRLSNLSDLKKIWSEFQTNIRTDIRKAEKKGIVIKENASVDEFLNLNKKVFARQNKTLPYSETLVKDIDRACKKRNCSKIFIAIDKEGQHHAAVYIVWDANSAYYIMGGGDPKLRNSGATSFCMWEAIKFSATITKSFDFEGSMIESVERFFRAYGAKQTSYNLIYKSNSRILDFLKATKKLLK